MCEFATFLGGNQLNKANVKPSVNNSYTFAPI